jgi:putative ATP-dependent endonuclease of OLD family
MRLSWVHINGFRNFNDAIINFSDKTLLIGANDIGKSNLLYALRLIFDRSLSDRDLELSSADYNAYSKADTIEITVCLSDVEEDCLKSAFVGAIKDNTTYIRYTNSKDTEYAILAGPGLDLLQLKQGRFYLNRISLEYVDTNRDLFSFIKRERIKLLGISRSLLGKEASEADKTSIDQLQIELDGINSNIDQLNYVKSALKTVNSELSKLSIHNEDQDIRFVAGNSDVNKMLDNLDLSYSANGSPLLLGGDGRNNQIFIATWASKQIIQRSIEHVTMFAIEEPEAHLHPHQQRKLSKYLVDIFDEQVFLTSHSPYIASQFKPDKMVKLCAKNKVSEAAQCGCTSKLKLTFDDFGYRLNAITAEAFFADGILLVEGPSERLFYSVLAQQLSIDLDKLNISVVSVDGIGFKPYIKICKALEIPYVMRTDDDIFIKTKQGKELCYFAGVSRAMGIYKELVAASPKSDKLLKYWNENKTDNEWPVENDSYTDEAAELNDYIRDELDNYNIYLSVNNLEKDLVASKLRASLSEYYGESDDCKLVAIMQKRKAENMLSYLEDYEDALKVLEDDDIVIPLKRIVSLVEKDGHPNE